MELLWKFIFANLWFFAQKYGIMDAISLTPQAFAAYTVRTLRIRAVDIFAKMPLRASIFAHSIKKLLFTNKIHK